MVRQETLEQYHASKSIGSSMLKVMLQSPKRYKAHFIDRLIEPKTTKALHLGAALHLALLEPAKFAARYAVEPALRRNTNAYKEWLSETLEADPSAIVISQDEMDTLKGMIDSVLAHRDAQAMLRKGIPEQSIYQAMSVPEDSEVQEMQFGVKARPDFLHENGDLIDIKTTRDAGFREFRRQAYELGYHISIKFHLDVVDLEFGRRDRNGWWIAVEKEPPYEVAVYRANDMVLEKGETEYRKALWLLARSQQTGVWPGKQVQAQDMDLLGYAQYD